MGRMSWAFEVPEPEPARDETTGRINWSLRPDT